MTETERARDVAAAVGGDADALQRLLMEYHTPLLRFVDTRLDAALRGRVDAEDVLQEAYVAAFNALTPSASGEEPSAIRHQLSASEGAVGDAEGEADTAQQQWHEDSEGGTAQEQWHRKGRLAFEGPAAFYKWLERIALNELREVQRTARRGKRDVGREVAGGAGRRDYATSCTGLMAQISGSGTSPSRALSRQETVAAVLTCLARLPDDQRTVVRLRFLEDVAVGEIAARLGKSVDAVYMLCHRGLKALRELTHSIVNQTKR